MSTFSQTLDGDCEWEEFNNPVDDDGLSGRLRDCQDHDISNTLKLTNFNGGSGIVPVGATIDGIAASCEWHDTGDDRWETSVVQLLKGGSAVGSNVGTAPATAIPNSATTTTFGGASDLWGTTWSDSEVNDPGFGVTIQLQVTGGAGTPDAWVDYCGVTVYYTP
jgi:hypothetical protein